MECKHDQPMWLRTCDKQAVSVPFKPYISNITDPLSVCIDCSGSQPFSSRDPISKYDISSRPHSKNDIVAQPKPLTATLRCSNNNRQDEEHIILHGSLHQLYLHSYA